MKGINVSLVLFNVQKLTKMAGNSLEPGCVSTECELTVFKNSTFFVLSTCVQLQLVLDFITATG